MENIINEEKDVYIQLDSDERIPSYAHLTDAGIDIRASEDVIIPPGGTVAVKTGLRLAVPEGYEMQVRPRSGCSLKTKLRISNSPGTIDAGYRGEIMVLVDNISVDYYWDGYSIKRIFKHVLFDIDGKEIGPKKAVNGNNGYYKISKGQRIAQLVFCKVEKANLKICSDVSKIDGDGRNSKGFGSSGTN